MQAVPKVTELSNPVNGHGLLRVGKLGRSRRRRTRRRRRSTMSRRSAGLVPSKPGIPLDTGSQPLSTGRDLLPGGCRSTKRRALAAMFQPEPLAPPLRGTEASSVIPREPTSAQLVEFDHAASERSVTPSRISPAPHIAIRKRSRHPVVANLVYRRRVGRTRTDLHVVSGSSGRSQGRLAQPQRSTVRLPALGYGG